MVSMYVSEFQRMSNNEKITLHITPDEVYDIDAGIIKHLILHDGHDQVRRLFVDDDRLHLILYNEDETETKDGEDE